MYGWRWCGGLAGQDTSPPFYDPWSWAGFYIGGHVGYGWKENTFVTVTQVNPLVTVGGIESKGSVYGGHAGFNWQQGWLVGGLELDISGTNIRGDSAPGIRTFTLGRSITDISSDDVKLLGTARGRVGFALGTGSAWNALLYGTGGLAWERVNRNGTTVSVFPPTTQTILSTDPKFHFGWVAGVGGELQVANTNWIARLEYLYYDFGQVEFSRTQPTFEDDGGRQTINVVRAGLSYKFGR